MHGRRHWDQLTSSANFLCRTNCKFNRNYLELPWRCLPSPATVIIIDNDCIHANVYRYSAMANFDYPQHLESVETRGRVKHANKE